MKIDHSEEGLQALSREDASAERPQPRERSGDRRVRAHPLPAPDPGLGNVSFGIGLNYWLDLNRIAKQGARWAVVNNWAPECLRTNTTCTQTPACSGVARTRVKLQNTLKCMATTKGLQDGVTVDICYPNTTNDAGDPVRVRLQQPYKFFFINSFRITLTAKATMRLEQPATLSKIVPDNGGACA